MATYPRPEIDPVAEASLATHAATKPAHGGDLAGTPRPPLSHVHIVDEVTGLQVALDERAAAVDLESLTLEVSAKADAADLSAYQPLSARGQANGYAALDGSGKIATAQLPALSITSTSTVASQASQLALSAQEGDVAVRTDESKSYIHNGGSTGTMSDWTLLATPADTVLSVAGKTGAVTLTASDVGAAPTVHTHTEAEITGLSVDLEGKASAATVTNLTARVAVIDNGTNWAAGVSQPIFIGKDAVGTRLNIQVGTEGDPDTTFAPAAKVSRTLSIDEGGFTGAGSLGLAAFAAVTRALSSSQGQAVGIEGGAVTASSYVGTHSNADAFGGGFTGRSTASSTRVGGGLFATGQRNHNEGKATGAEISAENNAELAGVYFSNAYSNVTGLWVAAKGLHDAAVGVVLGHPETVKFKVGYAATAGSVGESTFRDDSSSTVSIDIRSEHEFAIKLGEKAGLIDFGKNSFTNPGPLGNPYRVLSRVSGNANTSAAEAVKYFLISGQTNAKEVNPQGTVAANLPYIIIITGTDLAGPGTTKMRTSATVVTSTVAPGKTIKVGLYPITGAPTQTLGTVVPGSEAVIEAPAKESSTSARSSDYTPPADGIYALGYTVSGTPTAGFALQAAAEYHHV